MGVGGDPYILLRSVLARPPDDLPIPPQKKKRKTTHHLKNRNSSAGRQLAESLEGVQKGHSGRHPAATCGYGDAGRLGHTVFARALATETLIIHSLRGGFPFPSSACGILLCVKTLLR